MLPWHVDANESEQLSQTDLGKCDAYVLLLLKDMTNLEPNVGVRKRTRRVTENTVEANKGLVKLPLLLINNTETKEYFIFFVKI